MGRKHGPCGRRTRDKGPSTPNVLEIPGRYFHLVEDQMFPLGLRARIVDSASILRPYFGLASSQGRNIRLDLALGLCVCVLIFTYLLSIELYGEMKLSQRQRHHCE